MHKQLMNQIQMLLGTTCFRNRSKVLISLSESLRQELQQNNKNLKEMSVRLRFQPTVKQILKIESRKTLLFFLITLNDQNLLLEVIVKIELKNY